MPAPIALTGSFTFIDRVEFTASYVEINGCYLNELYSASALYTVFPDSASFAEGRILAEVPFNTQILEVNAHDFIYNEEDGDLNLYDQAYNALQTIAPFNSMSAITS